MEDTVKKGIQKGKMNGRADDQKRKKRTLGGMQEDRKDEENGGEKIKGRKEPVMEVRYGKRNEVRERKKQEILEKHEEGKGDTEGQT